jgi:hypothetical protein
MAAVATTIHMGDMDTTATTTITVTETTITTIIITNGTTNIIITGSITGPETDVPIAASTAGLEAVAAKLELVLALVAAVAVCVAAAAVAAVLGVCVAAVVAAVLGVCAVAAGGDDKFYAQKFLKNSKALFVHSTLRAFSFYFPLGALSGINNCHFT